MKGEYMPEKKWMVIDCHTHYLPPEGLTRTGKVGDFDYRALLKGEMSVPYKRIQDLEGTLRIMEDAGENMAVLNQSAWSPQGLTVCRAMNDGYARVKKEYAKKFIFCGHVPLQSGKEIVTEVERCIGGLGLQGISLPSSMPDVYLDDPGLWPMYEKIQELDVPIVIHPSVRFPIWGGGQKYELRRTISREYDIAKGCVEVMFGVLKDFPNLKFLFPHYGGGMAGLKGRLRAWFEPAGWKIPADIKDCPKTPRELKELGLDKAFDEIFDKIYFDTAGAGAGWLPSIQGALATIRTDRICFGTDYPYDMHTAGDIKSFIEVFKNLDIPENDRRSILGDNIRRLFKV
jgi:predicted TIM-barrel fold metal-dependent hydrolase